MQEKTLQAYQVEKRLQCSRSMVYKLLTQGDLCGYKVGRDWRIYVSSLDAYIARQKLAA